MYPLPHGFIDWSGTFKGFQFQSDLELTEARCQNISLETRIIRNNKTGAQEVSYWFRVIMEHEYSPFAVQFAIEGNSRFQFYLS